MQWIPTGDVDTKIVEGVVSTFFDDLKQLKMVLQPSKSGFVATTTKLLRILLPVARRLGVVKKQAIRNLGHEMHGTKLSRVQERARLRGLRARRRKLLILRQAVGARWPSC